MEGARGDEEDMVGLECTVLGVDGADAFVGRQIGYTVADVLAKCLFGLTIYKIARLKSAADDASYASSEGMH